MNAGNGLLNEWEQAFDAIPAMACIIDENNVITKANQAFLHAFKSSGTEIIGHLCFGLVHGTECVHSSCPHRKTLATGKSETAEFYEPHLGLYLHVTTSPIMDAAGHCSGSVHTIEDITERKLMRLDLEESEEKYRHIYEALSDAVFIIDPQRSRIIDTNRSAEVLLGRTRAEILHLPLTGLYPSGKAGEYSHIFTSHIVSGRAATYDAEIVRQDGSIVPVVTSVSLVDIRGSGMVLGVFHDITLRRKAQILLKTSEERFRGIIEQSTDGIVVIDQQGLLIEWNQAQENITGLKRETVLGKPIWDAQFMVALPEKRTPESHAQIKAMFHALLSRGITSIPSDSFETPIQRSVGDVRIIQSRVFPIALEQGFLIGSISRDITEQGIKDEELKAKSAFLEAQVNSSNDGILVVDAQGHVVLLNQRFMQIWDVPTKLLVSAADAPVLQHVAEKVQDRDAFLKKVTHLYAHPDETSQDEIALKNGTILERYSAPVLGKDGKSYGRIWVFHDITSSKIIEEELRSKTAFLEAQLHSSGDGILVIDKQGHVILENERSRILWGIPWKTMPDNQPESRLERISHKVKNPQQFKESVLYMYSHPDESLHDEVEFNDGTIIERYSAPVVGVDNVHYGRIWTFHDITRRKQIEDKLRKSEERYRLLAENSNDVIWTMSLDGHFTYVSPSIYQLRGYTPDEVLNQRIEEAVCPSSLPLLLGDMQLALREANEGLMHDVRYYEIEQPHKNGGTIWTEATARLIFDQNNRPVGVLGASRNITQRKKIEEALLESERQLTEIIQFLPDATMVINLKSEVVAWNHAMEELTGVKAEDMLGKGNYEYALPFYGERRPILIDRLLKPEKDTEEKYRFVERSGDIIMGEAVMPYLRGGGLYMAGTASILRNSRGEITGAIESIRDITESKKAQDQLKASLHEKETLLKEVHHRVKNNMQVISSLLKLQSDFVKDQEDAALFRESQDRIKSMSLVYNKLYQSKDLANINLKEYISELVENLVRSYNLTSAQITTIIDIDAISFGIEMAIPCGLIVNEIVVNSLKYAFKDGRAGLIQVEVHKLVDGAIEMRISDNGVGIPADFDLSHIKTLGMELIHTLVEQQLGGKMELDRAAGTAYRIVFSADSMNGVENGHYQT